MIRVENIEKSYDTLKVLKGVHLTINKSEITTIVGASGAGKSTLLHIIGTLDRSLSTSCVSITHSKLDVSELSYILDSEFNISNRSGLHCAPLAHKTIGTFPNGTVRLSVGYFNTTEEIKYTLDCLNKINNIYK